MGMDLKIIPLRRPDDLNDVRVSTWDVLHFDQDYTIFGQIMSIDGSVPTIKLLPIPAQMWIDKPDNSDEVTRNNSYGEELEFAYTEELKKLQLPDDATPHNRAIMAYINALPGDTPIILWWR